jgi:hypothetical protein
MAWLGALAEDVQKGYHPAWWSISKALFQEVARLCSSSLYHPILHGTIYADQKQEVTQRNIGVMELQMCGSPASCPFRRSFRGWSAVSGRSPRTYIPRGSSRSQDSIPVGTVRLIAQKQGSCTRSSALDRVYGRIPQAQRACPEGDSSIVRSTRVQGSGFLEAECLSFAVSTQTTAAMCREDQARAPGAVCRNVAGSRTPSKAGGAADEKVHL